MTAPLSPDEDVRAALVAIARETCARRTEENGAPFYAARYRAGELDGEVAILVAVDVALAALSTPVPEEEPLRCTECSNLIHASEETIIGEAPMHRNCANAWADRNADAIAGLPRGSASAAEGKPVAWFYEFLGHNDQWIADVRLAKPKAPSGGAIRNVRPLSFASALPSPLPSQGEPVADLPNVRGVDPQVITLAANLTAEQKRQPEWLWRNHDTGVLSFGRWPKPADLTPYVRADLVLEALAAAKARADSLKAELDEARQAIQEDGETIAECVTRAEAAEARADRAEEGEVTDVMLAAAMASWFGEFWQNGQLVGASVSLTETADEGMRAAIKAALRARTILKETPHGER